MHEGTRVVKERFQKIYSSQQKSHIQRTTWCYSWTENEKEFLNHQKGSRNIWVVIGWDGATISGYPLLNILDSAKNIPVFVLGIVAFQGHLADGNKKYGTFICNQFLDHMNK